MVIRGHRAGVASQTTPAAICTRTTRVGMPAVVEIYNRLLVCQGVRTSSASPNHYSPVSPRHGTTPFQPERTLCLGQSVQVNLQLGHRATLRTKSTADGFTHDWVVFVRGPEGSNIQHFVEKITFQLHESFPKPKRVVKEPPYQVAESGYGSFILPIEIYFKSKEEPRKIRFEYDLFLHLEDSPPVNHQRCEKLTFQNPTEEFRRRLIKAGGIGIPGPNDYSPSLPSLTTQQVANQTSQEKLLLSDLFGPPIQTDVPTKKHKHSHSKEKSSKSSRSHHSTKGEGSISSGRISSANSTPSVGHSTPGHDPGPPAGQGPGPGQCHEPGQAPAPEGHTPTSSSSSSAASSRELASKMPTSHTSLDRPAREKSSSKRPGESGTSSPPAENPSKKKRKEHGSETSVAKSRDGGGSGEKDKSSGDSKTKSSSRHKDEKSSSKHRSSHHQSSRRRDEGKIKEVATVQAKSSLQPAKPKGHEVIASKPTSCSTLPPFEETLSTGEQSEDPFEDDLAGDDVSHTSSHSFSSLKAASVAGGKTNIRDAGEKSGGGCKSLSALFDEMNSDDSMESDDSDAALKEQVAVKHGHSPFQPPATTPPQCRSHTASNGFSSAQDKERRPSTLPKDKLDTSSVPASGKAPAESSLGVTQSLPPSSSREKERGARSSAASSVQRSPVAASSAQRSPVVAAPTSTSPSTTSSSHHSSLSSSSTARRSTTDKKPPRDSRHGDSNRGGGRHGDNHRDKVRAKDKSLTLSRSSHNQNQQQPTPTQAQCSPTPIHGAVAPPSPHCLQHHVSQEEKHATPAPDTRASHCDMEKENKMDNGHQHLDASPPELTKIEAVEADCAPNGECFAVLLNLQKRLMNMNDRSLLQRVVSVIEETGEYKISDATFDFDLCQLDSGTVKRLRTCLEL